MNKNSNTLFGSKQNNTVVKNIVEAEPMMFGAGLPQTGGDKVAVRFAVHEGNTVAKGADGQLVFNKLGNTGAIYLGDTLVSSKILDVTYAQKTDASAGVNLVSVKFLKEDGSIDVSTFEVVDENAVKAWLADTSIFAAGDSYINAAVNATNNKKIDVSANVATPDKVKDLTDGKVALADAASFLDYIDTKAAAGTTEVVAAAGVNVAKSTNEADKHTVYTVGANLVFQYNAAVPASEGKDAVPATITLKSAVREGEAQVTYGTVNVSDIIGNGILASHSYNKTTGILTLNFKQADGSIKAESINLADMLDIDDVVIGDESANYLNVSLNATENDTHNMALDVKIKKMAEVADAVDGSDEGGAKPAVTGLADALDVRNFVLEKVAAVKAEGDEYVSASYDSKTSKITVATDVQNVTCTKGTAGVYNTEGAETTAPTHGTLAGVANALADSAQSMNKVKDYVDGEVAIEAARTDAAILAAVKALDKEDTPAINDEHLTIKYSETDGIVTINASTADIASKALLGTKADASTAETAFGYIAKEAALREQAIEALDTTVEDNDDPFIKISIVEENGLLSSTNLAITYGEMGTYGANGANGLATTNLVQTYIDNALTWQVIA